MTMPRFLWDVLRLYRSRVAIVFGFQLVSGLAEGFGLAMLLPLLVVLTGGDSQNSGPMAESIHKFMVDFGIPTDVPTLLMLMVVGIAVKALFVFLAWRQIGIATAEVSEDIRMRLLRALTHARWSYFVDQSVGSLSNAMGAQTMRAAGAFTVACKAFTQVVLLGVYFTLALWAIPWYATVGALLIAMVLFAALYYVTELRRRAERQETSGLNQLSIRITDGLRVFKTLKAMGAEDRFINLLRQDTRDISESQKLSSTSTAAVFSSAEPLIAIVLSVGIYIAVVHLAMPAVQLMFSAVIFVRTTSRAVSLQKIYHGLAGKEIVFGAMEDIIKLTHQMAEPQRKGTKKEIQQSIVLDGVSFRYGDRLILDSINAELPRGCLVVVSGPSGVGKTTLIDMLMALHQPTAGRILVDGVNLDEIDRHYWRQRLGYVSQESTILHQTVAANVSLERPGISDADIETALRRTEAWAFVEAMPGGTQATVGEHGARLSGGQRQRLAIARALAHRPRLLILDEPTSALDKETAEGIVQTLRRLAHEENVLVVAVTHHHLVAGAADIHYEIDDGKVRQVAGMRQQVHDRLAVS